VVLPDTVQVPAVDGSSFTPLSAKPMMSIVDELAAAVGVSVTAAEADHAAMVLGQLAFGNVPRYLAGVGELTDVPGRSPSRGPPYWKSVVLRKKALGDAA